MKIVKLIGCLLTVMFASSAVFGAEVDKTATLGPVIKIYKGDKCVRPTEFMRRNHMKLILHQRDVTMHEGIRTKTYLLTNCIDCHADPKTHSVLGKNGFCESCHNYAAVSIDCFSCHSPSPENSTDIRKASVSAPNHLIHIMQTSAVLTEGAAVNEGVR